MYKIYISKNVVSYFINLYNYLQWNKQDVEYVYKLRREFERQVRQILIFPHSCKFKKDAQTYQLLVYKKHVFCYFIDEYNKTINFVYAHSIKQNVHIKNLNY